MQHLPEAKISHHIVWRSRPLRSVKHQLPQTENRADTSASKAATERCWAEPSAPDDSGNPTEHDETPFVRSRL